MSLSLLLSSRTVCVVQPSSKGLWLLSGNFGREKCRDPKFITAVSQAVVPKISVVVRKCYGAGLYAMAGPAFGTDAVMALPTAQIAVMGPEAAINAIYANQIAEMPENQREPFRKMMEARYAEDIDIFRLASELIVDTITPFESLRDELVARYSVFQTKEARFSECRNPIYPV